MSAAARERRRLRVGPWAFDVAERPWGARPEWGGWESRAIVALTVSLMVFGLVTLLSASAVMTEQSGLPHYHYVRRQGLGVVVGLAGMVACSRIPTEWWDRMSHHILLIALVLLTIVVLPFTEAIAPTINGARRWLRLGVTTQPSDMAKLAVLIWTASMAIRKRRHFRGLWRGLVPFLLAWAAVLVLVVLEPDYSTALLIAALGVTIVFAAGARIGHFVLLGVLVAPLLIGRVTSGYRANRWTSMLLNPEDPRPTRPIRPTKAWSRSGRGASPGSDSAKAASSSASSPRPTTTSSTRSSARSGGSSGRWSSLCAIWPSSRLASECPPRPAVPSGSSWP